MKKPPLTIIAALASNNVIGTNNDIPWHIPEDLKRFMKLTSHHKIIMGRNTFESLPGGPLKNREHIIISRSIKTDHPQCTVVTSVEGALAMCDTNSENFVIGGGGIYKLFLPLCSKMYLTHIQIEIEGNVFFPEFDKSEWKVNCEEIQVSKSGLQFRYCYYNRRKNSYNLN